MSQGNEWRDPKRVHSCELSGVPRGSESNEFKACWAFSGSQGGPFSDTFLDTRGLERFLDFEIHLKANGFWPIPRIWIWSREAKGIEFRFESWCMILRS